MTHPAPPVAVGDATSWRPSAVQLEREAYRRDRSVRSALVATASTLVVVALAVVVLVTSPGWPRVRKTFLDPEVALASFPRVLDGLWLNLRVMLVSAVVIVVLALAIAIARTLRGPVFFPLRLGATIYVDVFRGLPVILVLLVVGFGLPGLRLPWIPTNVAVLGGIALVLTYTAYVAEVFRAGIESVHPSQVAAARSLGLTRWQTTRRVVLPQAVRRVTPPLLNDLISLSKDSGLISVLGAVDAVRAAQQSTAQYANFTPYVVAGLLFILVTIPLTRIADTMARRSGWLGSTGVAGGGVR